MHRAVFPLFVVSTSSGGVKPLSRLKLAVEHAKAACANGKDDAAAIRGLHLALRDWIESRIPGDKASFGHGLSSLESAMRTNLSEAGLDEKHARKLAANDDFGPGVGYVEFKFQRWPELPDTLLVTAGVSIPCGVDEAAYLYRFDATSRTRAVEDTPGPSFGHTQVELSQPDPVGRRSLLLVHLGVQCASVWTGMKYSVYRLGTLPCAPEKLLSETLRINLENGPEFDLKPQGVTLEFLDRDADPEIWLRTHIHKFAFTDGARRVDPVALQPQDFVEEWLTRPWAEMQSRSLAETEFWHTKLSGNSVGGTYSTVLPCRSRPELWLIGLAMDEKDLSKPVSTYFLVHELSKYHYQMEAVGRHAPTGCTGKSIDLDKHPWLPVPEIGTVQ
jgi:hypothetical protein